MTHSSKKMGFWAVFALVIGSQIGSGVLMLPANLAPYGLWALAGWIISGLGALSLAHVFAQLCAWLPQTGGPHVYVNHVFGRTAAFFTGWTYWVISWVSSTVLVISGIGYLLPLVGPLSPMTILFLEIILLALITALNFRGVAVAGRAEFLLTILKFIPLLIVPVCALAYFSSAHFMLDPSIAHLSTMTIISRVTLLALWGFIGLETATTAAESVDNPRITIPRAVLAGTLCVAAVYILNSLAIMGVIPGSELARSTAPYADAARIIFGGSWHLVIAFVASVICIGTLNAWVLTSGQIALGLAQDGLMPAWFGKKNKYDAPVIGLLISSLGMIPFLMMTMNENLATQILMVIDISVTSFVFVYLVSCLAFFKMLIQKNNPSALTAESFGRIILPIAHGITALLFCLWIIYQTPLITLAMASCFTLSGIPFYWWLRNKKGYRNENYQETGNRS